MEINLLNSTGIHKKDSHNFNDIDKSFISNSSDSLNNDFESEHNVDIKVSIKSSSRKKIFFVCFFTALIIGFSIYYKFFVNQKMFIESEKIQSFIQYVLDDNELNLLDFNFENYSIDLRLQIDYGAQFSDDFKKHVNGLIGYDKYSTEIIKNKNIQTILIKYPPFLEILNSDFNENMGSVDYGNLINRVNIDKKTLINFLNQSFKINKPKISSFKINKIDENHYNLQFPE